MSGLPPSPAPSPTGRCSWDPAHPRTALHAGSTIFSSSHSFAPVLPDSLTNPHLPEEGRPRAPFLHPGSSRSSHPHLEHHITTDDTTALQQLSEPQPAAKPGPAPAFAREVFLGCSRAHCLQAGGCLHAPAALSPWAPLTCSEGSSIQAWTPGTGLSLTVPSAPLGLVTALQ